MALRFMLPASALVIAACAGGGGSFSGDFQDTTDRAPSSLDGVQDTNKRSAVSNEGVPSTTERPGGGGGSTGTGASATATAGFNCLGTFKCTIGSDIAGAWTSKIPTATLRLPGVCTYQGSGFNPDGTVTKDGQVVGTWEVTANGFKVTESATASSTTGFDASTTSITVNVTLDCTKVSDSFTGDDDDDVAQPSTSTLDAGVRQ